MRGDADLVEMREDVLGNTVVQHAFAVDDVMLFLVEGGRVVLEELDERARLRTLIEDLGLALVDTAATIHGFCLCGCWRSWVARVEYLSGSITEKNGFHNRRIFPSPDLHRAPARLYLDASRSPCHFGCCDVCSP
ncbi:hypothetical protein D9M72_545210 [compost metagenome]